MFGEFKLTPRGHMGWLGQVGDGAVMSAGDAERAGRARGQHPVADVVIGVGAKAARRAVRFQRCPVWLAGGLHCRDDFEFGNIAKPVAAAATRPILEIYEVVAGLASKQFHGAASEASRADNAQGAKSFPLKPTPVG